MKTASLTFLVLCLLQQAHGQELSSYAQKVSEKIKNPALHQALINNENYSQVVRIAEDYKKRNSLNPGWLNAFRTWNSGETLQNRTALDNKRTDNMLIFEMNQGQPLKWPEAKISDSHFALALDTTNITDKEAPVVLILLSNQHVLNDYLSNNAFLEIRKMGFVLAVMEYPGFGISLGLANKKTWLSATAQAVQYLQFLTDKKIYLLGHSIGGPLALEAAATSALDNSVAGVISYGGFSTMTEQAKDQDNRAVISFFAPLIAKATMYQNLIDGVSGLKKLENNNVGVLILHGENDGPVPVRHAKIFQKEMNKLKPQNSEIFRVKIFSEMAHEEVNNFTPSIQKSEDDFYQIWNEIKSFVLATKKSQRLNQSLNRNRANLNSI